MAVCVFLIVKTEAWISFFFFFSSRRRHTRWNCDWSSDVCSSDLAPMHDRHHDGVKVESLLRQDVFVALGRVLIRDPAQHAEPHQLFQALGQKMAGDPERGLKRFKPSPAQKTF